MRKKLENNKTSYILKLTGLMIKEFKKTVCFSYINSLEINDYDEIEVTEINVISTYPYRDAYLNELSQITPMTIGEDSVSFKSLGSNKKKDLFLCTLIRFLYEFDKGFDTTLFFHHFLYTHRNEKDVLVRIAKAYNEPNVVLEYINSGHFLCERKYKAKENTVKDFLNKKDFNRINDFCKGSLKELPETKPTLPLKKKAVVLKTKTFERLDFI